MRDWKRLFFHGVAELESLLVPPEGDFHWRQRELRALGVHFGERLSVGSHMYVHRRGNLIIGARVSLGSYVQLINCAPIAIGDGSLFASHLTISTETRDPVTLQPGCQSVTIGQRVWSGLNVIILAGVSIGDDVVIGAGSVVTSDVPADCVVAGRPARIIRQLDRSGLAELRGSSIRKHVGLAREGLSF